MQLTLISSMKLPQIPLWQVLFGLVALLPAAVTVAIADTNKPISWFQESKESNSGAFEVTLDSNSSVASLNDFQNWLLTVRNNKSGEIVSRARINVSGGMPMHGHGLPTQPQATEYLGKGQYKLEGVKFNMHGQWELAFEITAAAMTDVVVFEVVVDY